ncbi:MAG: hypothetical protein RLZZ519_212 [Bacteroidota bacterium]|jgi:hypothetical protein
MNISMKLTITKFLKRGLLLLLGCTLLYGCNSDIRQAQPITQHLNTDLLALQCDRTNYVEMDTFPYFDMLIGNFASNDFYMAQW